MCLNDVYYKVVAEMHLQYDFIRVRVNFNAFSEAFKMTLSLVLSVSVFTERLNCICYMVEIISSLVADKCTSDIKSQILRRKESDSSYVFNVSY